MPGSIDQDRQEIDLRDTAEETLTEIFARIRVSLIAGTLVPSIEQGVAPLTALGGSAPVTFDLSGAASRRTSERIVGMLLWLCGALSLLTTVGIIAVLIQQALVFFAQVPVTDFLFGTTWTALFKTPQYGVLPLVAGTLMITVIAMAVSIPLGLMSAIYLSEYAATASSGHSQAVARASGGDSDDRLWLLRRHVHSAGYSEAHFPGNRTIQRAGGRDRRRHHDHSAGRLAERGCHAGGPTLAT